MKKLPIKDYLALVEAGYTAEEIASLRKKHIVCK